MSYWKIFKNGIFGENPVFRLALSLCPAVAVTVAVKNSILLGIAVVFVMTMVNITVSVFRNYIHPRARFPVYMFVIATWVTVSDLVIGAYQRGVYKEIGLYIQLIVAFAIVLSRAELFASKNRVFPSGIDGLGMGVGFLVALVIIGFMRELLGKGALLGFQITESRPLLIMILPAGGFFAMGLLMALFNWIERRFYGGKGAPEVSHL